VRRGGASNPDHRPVRATADASLPCARRIQAKGRPPDPRPARQKSDSIFEQSPMASPIVCVAKKDGGVRIDYDYRYLNSCTVDAFDVKSASSQSATWQIPLAEEHRWLTAFVTHDGLYEWLRMSFGLTNAGATFVSAVRSMLRPIRDFADSYFDDIEVGSQDWKTHLHHIRRFLNIVRKAGMTLNLAKCEFGKPKVKFVGRLVGSGNHLPDPQRLQGLAKIEVPCTKKELRALLGAFGYYRKYIHHFSAIAMLLTDLSKNGVPSVITSRWSGNCQQAYERLKSELPHKCSVSPSLGHHFIFISMLVGRPWEPPWNSLTNRVLNNPWPLPVRN